jgi:hypothetical protein
MPAPNPSLITWLVLLPLIAWRMVARVKRMIRRQPLTRWRPLVTLTLFPLLLWLLAMTAFVPPNPPQPLKLLWLAAGLVAGGAVGVHGLKRTRFDETDEGLFYTPDARLGIALSAVFIARLAWRLGSLIVSGPQAQQGYDFALSPYTLAPVGLFSGYFMVYAVGLLVRRSRMLRSPSQGGAAP